MQPWSYRHCQMQRHNVPYMFLILILFRFMDGLSTLGVLNMLQMNQSLMKEAFVPTGKRLSATGMAELLNVMAHTWSPEGSQKRLQEATTISFWLDFLQDLEGKFYDLL